MIAIDGHAHIYAGTDPIATLMEGGHRLHQMDSSLAGAALLLCEPRGQDAFGEILLRLAEAKSATEDLPCTVLPTNEDDSVILASAAKERVVVIRGQQVVTSERLEVLVVGQNGDIPDDKPLGVTIERAISRGCHVILPWGVGKWLGARGKLIDQALQNLSAPNFHIGDNGGRPFFWPVPQFSAAARKGIKLLRGSDPLPIPRDERRLGTYASVIPCHFDIDKPWAAIRRALGNPDVQPSHIGTHQGIRQFLWSQAALRVRSRRMPDVRAR